MSAYTYHLWNPFTDLESFLPYKDMGPFTIVRGEGAYVYNEKGQQFINASSSLWNVAVGHGRKEIIEAATKQMETLSYASCFGQTHPRAIELAEKLCHLTKDYYSHAYLGSNGSEAIDCAFKIVRQYWRQKGLQNKYQIISFTGAYHGVSFGAISASGEIEQEKYGPLLPGFLHIEPPYAYHGAYGEYEMDACEDACLKALKQCILSEGADTIGAFILEPIMGDKGIIPISDRFIERLGVLCKQYQILLIADEITTGFGRTGKWFVSEDWAIKPDILCVGKGISSGYLPLSATLVTPEIYECFKGKENMFLHGSTASGHPVCAAVGLANIKILEEENLIENVNVVGKYLKAKLEELKEEKVNIGDVRGRGLMIGLELVTDKQTREPLEEKKVFKIVADLAAQGVLVYYNNNIIALFPTFIITKEIADQIVDAFDKAFATNKSANFRQSSRILKQLMQAKLKQDQVNI